MVYPRGAERVRLLKSQAFADTLNAAKKARERKKAKTSPCQEFKMDERFSTIHDSTDSGACRRPIDLGIALSAELDHK